MRGLSRFIAGLLALCLALAPVQAGNMLPLLGIGGSATTPFAINFVGTNSNTTAATSFTFTAQAIGTPDPTRIVAVGISHAINTVTVSSVTIGGSAATQVSGAACNSTGGSLGDIWYLAVPSGTTANIVINFSASQSRVAIAVYSVIGTGVSVSSGANAGGPASTSITQSATIPAGGGAIGIATLHTSAPGAITPTNLTNDTGTFLAFGNSAMIAGNNTTSSGLTTMGYSYVTSTDRCISLATFNP